MKYIKASTVAVIMPFSAVITSIISIISGNDKISANLIWGGILCVAAVITAEFKPYFKNNK